VGASDYRLTRVVVLGATGFIGRWVARALVTRGADLYLVVRDPSAAAPVFARFGVSGTIVEAQLENPDAVTSLFRRLRPSVTFNLAGYGVDPAERGQPDEGTAYRINADLVQAVGEALSAGRDPTWRGQDLVHVGSALEYGEIGGDLAEDSPPNPTTLYGKSKLAGTRVLTHCCASYGLRGLTARLFTVYGPGEHAGRLLPSLLECGQHGTALPLTTGTQQRDFGYVQDVAEGLLRLGLTISEPGEIVNLATGRLSTVRQFVETAAGIIGIPSDRLLFGALPGRPEEMAHREVNVRRLLGLTGWVPTTRIADGVRKTLDFERATERAAT
jgi:UDP-glucose 4-epimerase